MAFTAEHQDDVFQILAGILHLGNTTFLTAGGAQVEDRRGVLLICSVRVIY